MCILQVVTVGRREVAVEDADNKIHQKIVDFDNLAEHKDAFQNVDKVSRSDLPRYNSSN